MNLLNKRRSRTIKNEGKEQKRGFLLTLLDTLTASLLGSGFSDKGVVRASEETIRAGQDF